MSQARSAPRPSGGAMARSAPVVGASLAGVLLLGVVLMFHNYSIPSASNLPTLQVNDVIIGSKLAYGISRYSFPIDMGFRGRLLGSAPRRGDMAIFALPRDPATTYIKRVIGLPGDRIQMKAGRLILNGATVPRTPVAKLKAEDDRGVLVEVPTYRETLPNGIADTIIEVRGDTGFNDNTDEAAVPPGRYYTLGDNRDNSLDSRVKPDQGGVGTVPLDNFIARAEFVPYNGLRRDRILVPLR